MPLLEQHSRLALRFAPRSRRRWRSNTKPIIRNRCRASVLEDLGAAPQTRFGKLFAARKLRMGITRAIQSKRTERRWTVHELHAAAELQCLGNTGCVIFYPKPVVVLAGATPTIDGGVPYLKMGSGEFEKTTAGLTDD